MLVTLPYSDFTETPENKLTKLNTFAKRALAHFDLPQDCTMALVNLSENATFCVTAADGRQWALRIHRKNYHSAQEVVSELAWVIALRRAGEALTPQPIAGRDGNYVQSIVVAQSEDHRLAVLFHWQTGREPHMTQNLAPHFQALGAISARMHAHAKIWQRPQGFTRLHWDFAGTLGEVNPHWGRWRSGIGLTSDTIKIFVKTIALIEQRLLKFGQGTHRFGLIHGDCRLANLLIEGTEIKIIDFDDCGFGWFMYDAAVTVSFHEHDLKVPELLAAWASGYRTVATLSVADENEIPTFVILRRLLLVAWLGSRPETDLAKTLGENYTTISANLCEDYLSRFS